MSISIYYAARRERLLSSDERTAVDRLVARYSIRDRVEQHIRTGRGHNGESFHVYDRDNPSEPDVIFEGATQLPDNNEAALWELVQHWCRLLSDVRRVVPGAEWHVHVDDQDIVWDEQRQAYDPMA